MADGTTPTTPAPTKKAPKATRRDPGQPSCWEEEELQTQREQQLMAEAAEFQKRKAEEAKAN